MNAGPQLRRATGADANSAAEVYLRARRLAVPEIPPLAHPDDEVRQWMHRVLDEQEAWLAVADDGTVLGLMVLDGDWVGQLSDFPQSRLHRGDGRDCGELESGEADVQDEVSEPQVEYSASGSVHNERQQDDGQD